MLGINRLVAFLIGRFALAVHVVRQSQSAIDLRVHKLIPADVAVALIIDAFHGAGGIAHLNRAAHFHLLARAHQAFPHEFLRQSRAHQFDTAIIAEIAGRYHLGVVEHKVVTGLHIFHDIVEMAVLDEPGIAVHHKHATGGAIRQRAVGNQFFRQVVIEIDGAHGRRGLM